MKPFALLTVAFLAAGPVVWAQPTSLPPPSTSALISEQLDRPIQLKLNNSPLPQVLASITEQTGVPIRVSADVYDLLPYGTQTPITATIENLSLRKALEAICGKLALRVDLRAEYVELSPEPALRRVGRRATLQELRTLDLLGGRSLDLPANANPTLLSLTQSVDKGLGTLDAELTAKGQPPAKLVVELRSVEDVDVDQVTVRLARGTTLRNALDAIADQTKLTWYPWGDSIVVLSKKSVIRNLLEKPLSLRYDGVDVTQVYADLAARTGVDFMIEPGAIQRVTPEFRIIKLSADAPVRQSLESLQGYTGLSYVINDDGVYIWNQNSAPAASRRRVAATIEISPGVNIMVYEDQLSPEALEAMNTRRDQAAKAIEQSLTGKPTPTTQPAHYN